jgi:hypothetical protein
VNFPPGSGFISSTIPTASQTAAVPSPIRRGCTPTICAIRWVSGRTRVQAPLEHQGQWLLNGLAQRQTGSERQRPRQRQLERQLRESHFEDLFERTVRRYVRRSEQCGSQDSLHDSLSVAEGTTGYDLVAPGGALSSGTNALPNPPQILLLVTDALHKILSANTYASRVTLST